MLGRRIGRHGLLGKLKPRGYFAAHVSFAHMLPRRFGHHLALNIPSVGGLPKAKRAAVYLAAPGQQMARKLGGLTKQNQQHPRGQRIKRARMPNFFLPQAFDGRKATGRCGPGGLAQHQNAVLLGQLGRPGAFFRLPVCGGGCSICRCDHTHTQVVTLAAERA